MDKLLDRIAAADGLLARTTDRLASALLPSLDAAGGCGTACTCTRCNFGHYRCRYCNGYWSSPCTCSSFCTC